MNSKIKITECKNGIKSIHEDTPYKGYSLQHCGGDQWQMVAYHNGGADYLETYTADSESSNSRCIRWTCSEPIAWQRMRNAWELLEEAEKIILKETTQAE